MLLVVIHGTSQLKTNVHLTHLEVNTSKSPSSSVYILTECHNWFLRVGAWIMMLSTIPYLCVQVPLLDGHPTEGPEAALVGCIVAVVGVLAYCTYQVCKT